MKFQIMELVIIYRFHLISLVGTILSAHCRCRSLLPDHTQTHTNTHSVDLLWRSDRTDAETSTTQHSQETDIHASGGIRTQNPSKRAVVDLSG